MTLAIPAPPGDLRINALEALASVSQKVHTGELNPSLFTSVVDTLGKKLADFRIYMYVDSRLSKLMKASQIGEVPDSLNLPYQFVYLPHRGEAVSKQERLTLPSELLSELKNGQPLCKRIHETSPEIQAWAETKPVYQLFFWLPILIDKEVWGVIGLDPQAEVTNFETYRDALIDPMTAIARSVSLKIETEYRITRDAQVLEEIGSHSIENTDTLLDSIYRYVDESFSPDMFYVATIGADEKFLRILTFRLHGEEQDEWANVSLPIYGFSGLGGWVVRNNQPLYIRDAQTEELPVDIFPVESAGLPRSWLGIPVVVYGKTVGVIAIQSFQPNRFSRKDFRLFNLFANQVGTAIFTRRLYQKERDQFELSQTLKGIASNLTIDLPLDAFFERFFDLLAPIVPFDSISVMLRDAESGRMALIAVRGYPDQDAVEADLEQYASIIESRFEDGQDFVLIPDTKISPEWVRIENTNVFDIRSWIGTTLEIRGERIGYLNINSRSPFAFNENLAQTVLAFANQAVIALDGSRLYEKLRRRAKEIALLHELARFAESINTIEELIEYTVKSVLFKRFPLFVAIGMLNQDGTQVNALDFYPNKGLQRVVFDFHGQGLTGKTLKTGQTQIVSDVLKNSDYIGLNPLTRSEIVVPIKMDQKSIGFLNIESPELDYFGTDDLAFVETVAGQLAVSLLRLELHQELQEYTESLEHLVEARTEALVTERDRMLRIFETAGEGIFISDADGIITFVNNAMVELSGYAEEEIIGRRSDLFRVDSNEPPVDALDQHANGQDATQESTLRRKDGSFYPVKMSISEIYDEESRISGYVSICSDISALVKTERLKSDFVTGISHELRTPLTNLKAYGTLIAEGKPEKRPRYIKVLNQEILRLEGLIQNLLDFSHLEEEDKALSLSKQLIGPIVKHSISELDDLASREHVDLNFSQVGELPELWINRSQLQKALHHIILNGINYSDGSDCVTITLKQDEGRDKLSHVDEMVVIEVSDSGVGMSAEEQSRIFDRFYRSERVRDLKPGTGLGLTIAHEIIERHGGFIAVESQEEVGSSFQICLPIV